MTSRAAATGLPVPLEKSSLHGQTTMSVFMTTLPTIGHAAAQCQRDRAGADPSAIAKGSQTAPHQGPQG
jgi:hypothetical protein